MTFLALPGYGLSCRINDVDFLRKEIKSFSKPCRNLEVRVNSVICDRDADGGINGLLTGKLEATKDSFKELYSLLFS